MVLANVVFPFCYNATVRLSDGTVEQIKGRVMAASRRVIIESLQELAKEDFKGKLESFGIYEAKGPPHKSKFDLIFVEGPVPGYVDEETEDEELQVPWIEVSSPQFELPLANKNLFEAPKLVRTKTPDNLSKRIS